MSHWGHKRKALLFTGYTTMRVKFKIFLKIYLFICCYLFWLCWVFAAVHRRSCGIWDLSSLTRDQTWALSIRSVESYPLDHEGSPSFPFEQLTVYACWGNIKSQSLTWDCRLSCGQATNLNCIFSASEWVSEVAQSCPTLCDPVDCSPPSSSVHGILQARVLEWVASSFSRGNERKCTPF